MEKEKLLLSRPPPPPPQLSQPHLNSLGSSPSNSTSNSMEFHPHHHHHQQQQQHNHHNNNHVGVGMGLGDLNCFLNLNWENSMMGGGMDDSALSSMVSSPLAPPQLLNSTTTNSLFIRELIGRLGNICNSGDPQFNNSHSTILELDHQNHQQQQPHNPNLSLDLGFCERTAKYSCFNSSIPRVVDNGNGNGSGKLSRVSSTQSLLKSTTTTTTSDGGKLLSRSCTPDNNAAEFEESSASDPNLKDHVNNNNNNNNNNNSSRKRKAAPKPKSKDLPSSTKDSKITAKDEDESKAKRCKPSETTEKEKVVVEPPKDYIHVRARRGQATDSHSLAERVRREKISERMKFLQDLVPGCNKVTGKAVMLDEIINYVQSLQRQVEFLSMKLSTVNPRMEFNMESLLSKDMLQSHGSSALTVHPTDALASTFPYGQPPHQGPSLQNGISNGMENHCSMPLDAAQRLSLSMQLPALDGFGDGDSQLAAFWDDDLQSFVQMGFGQNQGKEVAFQTQNFHGSLPTSHMKVEL